MPVTITCLLGITHHGHRVGVAEGVAQGGATPVEKVGPIRRSSSTAA
jgi:hypothetical protein